MLALATAGCDQTAREADKPITPQAVTSPAPVAKGLLSAQSTADTSIKLPADDVRQAFIAKPQPVLDSGASVSILAASRKNQKPKALVEKLGRASALVFAKDGTLYFIGDHENAIFAIQLDMTGKVIATSGVMSYVTPDDKTEPEPLYNTFEELSITPDGNLLTLRNRAYPFEINTETGEARFLGFVLPDGTQINSVMDFDSVPNPAQWTFKKIYSFQGKVLLATAPYFSREKYAVEPRKWFFNSPNARMKPVDNLSELPASAYLLEFGSPDSTFAPDGYIYAIEKGKGKQDHDRVIRIGAPGLSSLRKEASRVTIAEFKHGELTGALAFSPKGELAVGAENAIYLISPKAAK
ncbi:MAG: hypothetical protein U0997_14040 [Sulfurimicrobium sp.]|nr:hypothetical protein [Sulfurimicrobium sp.]